MLSDRYSRVTAPEYAECHLLIAFEYKNALGNRLEVALVAQRVPAVVELLHSLAQAVPVGLLRDLLLCRVFHTNKRHASGRTPLGQRLYDTFQITRRVVILIT